MKLSLLEQLQEAVQTNPTSPLTLKKLVKSAEKKGFGLILMSLSLPSALPVPAPGYSTPFGIIIAIFAWQMIRGKSSPALPVKWQNKEISRNAFGNLLKKASKFVRLIEFFIRPRMRWIQAPFTLTAFGFVILLMAGLMILPIPLTNTFPAFIIFCLGAALCEEDGVMALLASLMSIFAIFLYIFVIYLLITQGSDAVQALKESIKNLR